MAACWRSPAGSTRPDRDGRITELQDLKAVAVSTLSSPNPRQATGNAQRRYGDMPLIVLTAGRDEESALGTLSALPSGTPGLGTPAELAQLREQISRFLRDGWGAGHDAYAALSTRGRNQLVPDSTHGIQNHKPEVVISAVIEVLDEIRPSALHEP